MQSENLQSEILPSEILPSENLQIDNLQSAHLQSDNLQSEISQSDNLQANGKQSDNLQFDLLQRMQNPDIAETYFPLKWRCLKMPTITFSPHPLYTYLTDFPRQRQIAQSESRSTEACSLNNTVLSCYIR